MEKATPPVERFPLTSEQLELLMAFESAQGLSRLASLLAKDPSVISRNLQRLGEALPVIQKQSGKWRITELGRQVNLITRKYLADIEGHLPGPQFEKSLERPCFSKKAMLLVINAQKGLLDPTQAPRNNTGAEERILKLLTHWREKKKPVMHIKHVSENSGSLFFRHAEGVEFLPSLAPLPDEPVIEKYKSSAFSGTGLAEQLEKLSIETLILVGFTAAECIDASTRQASDLGYSTYVVGDATATFDLKGPDGKPHPADRVHQLVLASLHAYSAEVIPTELLLVD